MGEPLLVHRIFREPGIASRGAGFFRLLQKGGRNASRRKVDIPIRSLAIPHRLTVPNGNTPKTPHRRGEPPAPPPRAGSAESVASANTTEITAMEHRLRLKWRMENALHIGLGMNDGPEFARGEIQWHEVEPGSISSPE
jgi:hypothetical protein